VSGSALAAIWRTVGGDPRLLSKISVQADRLILRCALPVGDFAVACVASALLAAADLAQARGLPAPAVTLDAAHVEASFTSERHVRVNGRTLGSPFAPLSTWLRTSDGWLRSHANYPQHRTALLAALGAGAGADVQAVRAAAVKRRGAELEEKVFAAGGCAAVLRNRTTWDAHPQGAALQGRGLLDLDHGPPGANALPELRAGELPAAGVRVLDLTRVIAGPVAARTLAALGADVLRIDAPGAVELDISAIDTGPGKRSAQLDLRSRSGASAFHDLLADADVLIEGYRPGAIEALGFGAGALARRYPHLVTATLSAWGDAGPWGERRGFDSLVQAAAGIAVECTTDDAQLPGSLPAQALDHGTGHLIAAVVLRGLAERTRYGQPLQARFALARTAAWLLDLPRAASAEAHAIPLDADPFLIELPSSGGVATIVAPPGELDGRVLRWTRGPEPIGASRAAWTGAHSP
jgi:hypothetical protein